MADMMERQEDEGPERRSGEPERRIEEPKRNFEFIKGVLFGILLSAICVMAWYLIQNGTVGFMGSRQEGQGTDVLTSRAVKQKLADIQQKIDQSFLYEADGELLSACLFKGLAVGLMDPYASYYTAEEVKNIVEINEGEYHGIGITLLQDTDSGNLRVAGIYEGSPAWEAGMQVDDEIIRVEDENITGMDMSAVIAMIKEKEGSVRITVLRDQKELEFDIVPADVEIPTVSCEMLEEGIGYLKITEFDSITVGQFEDALEDLESRGMEQLIVDVRDNPGGMLDAICDILDDILPEGLILYTEDKDGNREEYYSDEERILTKPLVVLVNGNSASASEIFAGAIQDYCLGTIMGTQTYGKGVVQRTFLLDDGSALKMTTEKYYTAKGQDIDGHGITPDVVVETEENETEDGKAQEDVQLQRAVDFLKNDR